MNAAVVVFSLLTGEPHFAAVLDTPQEINDPGFRPIAGEGRARITIERWRTIVDSRGYPDLTWLWIIAGEARLRLLQHPNECLPDAD